MKTNELTSILRMLVADLPEFRVKGQLAAIVPMGHTLRGIFLDRSIDKRAFYVQVFLQPLCVPVPNIGFNAGWRIGSTWIADDSSAISALKTKIRSDAIPFLKKIQSPNDAAQAALSLNKSADVRVKECIAYAYALGGSVQESIAAFTEIKTALQGAHPSSWQFDLAAQATRMISALQNNPTELQVRLNDSARRQTEKLGLGEFT